MHYQQYYNHIKTTNWRLFFRQKIVAKLAIFPYMLKCKITYHQKTLRFFTLLNVFFLFLQHQWHRSAELNVNKNLIISYLIIMQFVLFSDKEYVFGCSSKNHVGVFFFFWDCTIEVQVSGHESSLSLFLLVSSRM